MTITLLHNKNCSKSRACVEILKGINAVFNIREYLKEPLTIKEVQQLVKNFDGDKQNLIRTSQENLSERNLVNYIFNNQKDLQRPILDTGKKFVICRPPEKVLDYF